MPTQKLEIGFSMLNFKENDSPLVLNYFQSSTIKYRLVGSIEDQNQFLRIIEHLI